MGSVKYPLLLLLPSPLTYSSNICLGPFYDSSESFTKLSVLSWYT